MVKGEVTKNLEKQQVSINFVYQSARCCLALYRGSLGCLAPVSPTPSTARIQIRDRFGEDVHVCACVCVRESFKADPRWGGTLCSPASKTPLSLCGTLRSDARCPVRLSASLNLVFIYFCMFRICLLLMCVPVDEDMNGLNDQV